MKIPPVAIHGLGVVVPTLMEDICLKHDNGNEMRFQGRLYSECSSYDEDSGSLVRQQLYVTESGEKVYYIVRGHGQDRTRHAYRLSVKDDYCVINNGQTEISLQFDLLVLVVSALCGMKNGSAPTREMVEEMLKAANA